MSISRIVMGEYINGRVLEKYRLRNGNVAVVIEQRGTGERYHVEFRDDKEKPSLDNLYGLLSSPCTGKTEHIDQLVRPGANIGVTVGYSKSPFREAYSVHNVSYVRQNNRPRVPEAPFRVRYRRMRTQGY